MKRVAVVGSRGIANSAVVEAYVRGLWGCVVITGGARGVDTTVEMIAKEEDILCAVICPDYNKHGRSAPLMRNTLIAALCDRMVGFHDGTSTGTLHALAEAKKLGKPTKLIRV